MNTLSTSPNQTGAPLMDDDNDFPKGSVDHLKQNAMNGAREASDLAAKEAARIGDLARDWWHRNAQVAMDAAGAVKQEAAAIGDHTQRYVRHEPVKSLLAAAAAGALITGLIMMASRHR
jgi:ElaB/YqjD/DUF883 family membrane-anchored ribosome-binding protein